MKFFYFFINFFRKIRMKCTPNSIYWYLSLLFTVLHIYVSLLRAKCYDKRQKNALFCQTFVRPNKKRAHRHERFSRHVCSFCAFDRLFFRMITASKCLKSPSMQIRLLLTSPQPFVFSQSIFPATDQARTSACQYR